MTGLLIDAEADAASDKIFYMGKILKTKSIIWQRSGLDAKTIHWFKFQTGKNIHGVEILIVLSNAENYSLITLCDKNKNAITNTKKIRSDIGIGQGSFYYSLNEDSVYYLKLTNVTGRVQISCFANNSYASTDWSTSSVKPVTKAKAESLIKSTYYQVYHGQETAWYKIKVSWGKSVNIYFNTSWVNDGSIKIELRNSQGKTISSQVFKKKSAYIKKGTTVFANVNYLPAGTYYVMVKGASTKTNAEISLGISY